MRALSLFSGIGAHDYGLQMAGCEIAGQVEWDPWCQAVLAKHWPDVPRWADVRDVRADDVLARCGRIDLVTGGVPCQPASVAGKRLGAADSRWLWPEYLRLVVDLRPEWILAENVPGFLSLGESGQVLADLEAAGYEVWPLVVGAWAVGAPHKRDRVWMVGRLADAERIAEGMHRPGGDSAATCEGRGGADGTQNDWADGSGLRWPARPGEPQHEWEAPRLVAHADRRRCDGGGQSESGGEPGASGRELDGRCDGWSACADNQRGPVEPGLGRTTPGATRRLDSFARRNRLKALGNANPPHVPYLIGRWLCHTQR